MNINIDELEDKLNSLTGADFEAAQKNFKLKNPNFVGVTQLESAFQIELAAMALGINANELKALPLRKYNKILRVVNSFLFTDSDEDETVEKSSDKQS